MSRPSHLGPTAKSTFLFDLSAGPGTRSAAHWCLKLRLCARRPGCTPPQATRPTAQAAWLVTALVAAPTALAVLMGRAARAALRRSWQP